MTVQLYTLCMYLHLLDIQIRFMYTEVFNGKETGFDKIKNRMGDKGKKT